MRSRPRATSQLLEEDQSVCRWGSRGWSGPQGQATSGEWATDGAGPALSSGWRTGKASGGEQPLLSGTFYPHPPQLPEGSPHAPYSLPDITNCLVTFSIL